MGPCWEEVHTVLKTGHIWTANTWADSEEWGAGGWDPPGKSQEAIDFVIRSGLGLEKQLDP